MKWWFAYLVLAVFFVGLFVLNAALTGVKWTIALSVVKALLG